MRHCGPVSVADDSFQGQHREKHPNATSVALTTDGIVKPSPTEGASGNSTKKGDASIALEYWSHAKPRHVDPSKPCGFSGRLSLRERITQRRRPNSAALSIEVPPPASGLPSTLSQDGFGPPEDSFASKLESCTGFGGGGSKPSVEEVVDRSVGAGDDERAVAAFEAAPADDHRAVAGNP